MFLPAVCFICVALFAKTFANARMFALKIREMVIILRVFWLDKKYAPGCYRNAEIVFYYINKGN
jgi:hypothetical protein